MSMDEQLDIENLACNWLSCFKIKDGPYLCAYHEELVLSEIQSRKRTFSNVETKNQNKCGVKYCKKDKCIDNHICFDHLTSFEALKIRKEFNCKRKKCKQVINFSSKRFCTRHMNKYEK
jgi:hypothetical protein